MRVSIHLREWGALHQDALDPIITSQAVSIHLREWGALHLGKDTTVFVCVAVFQFTFVSGVPCTRRIWPG